MVANTCVGSAEWLLSDLTQASSHCKHFLEWEFWSEVGLNESVYMEFLQAAVRCIISVCLNHGGMMV